jgi:hypothetical protein
VTERRCVCCPHLRQGDPRIYERPNVCEGCRLRLATLLAEITGNYQLLDDELAPNRVPGQRVSGSKSPPLPLRVDPLDLTMPAPTGRQLWTRITHPADQIGQLPVAAVLDSWVRDWLEVLNLNESHPTPLVFFLAVWLSNRLDKACDTHAAIDDFAREIRDLAAQLRRTVGVTEVRPEHLDVPCRRCDLLDLHRLPGQDRVECGSCGDLLTEDEYRRWVGLLASTMGQSA